MLWLLQKGFIPGIKLRSYLPGFSLLLILCLVQGCTSEPPEKLEIVSVTQLRDAMETRNWREAEAAVALLKEEFHPELIVPLLELWEETSRNEVQHRCFRILNHWGIPVVRNEYLERLREELHSWNSQVKTLMEEGQQDEQWLNQVSRHLRSFGVPLRIMDNLSSRNMRVIRDRALAEVHQAIRVVDQGDVPQTKQALQQLHGKLQNEMVLLGETSDDHVPKETSTSEGQSTPGRGS